MVRIRRVRVDEGPAFRAIRLQAVQGSPTAFGSTFAEIEARPGPYWQRRAEAGAAGENQVLFVADDNGRWIGLVGAFLEDDDGRSVVELVSMFVDPDHRGTGLGRALINAIVEWAHARGAGRVVLWVTENNAPAIALYRRCGFEETARSQPVPSHPALSERQMIRNLSPD